MALVALLLHAAAAAPEPPEPLDPLWLRQGLVADAAQLRLFRQQLGAVAIAADEAVLADAHEVAQLRTAAEELSSGLSRMLGRNVSATCCSSKPASAHGHLAVSVAEAHLSTLGTEGFTLASADGDPLYAASLRAATASGALHGAFRLLGYVQRTEPLPQELESIPQMELRIWDLWDDTTGDVTRGFAGDSLLFPNAMWKDPNTQDGPPPTKLFVAPCDATDTMQHWAGRVLSQPGAVSGFRNGNGQCVSADKNPPYIAPCSDAADNNTLFWYNTTALQLSIGPLVPGVNGTGRECFDINHAQGPDIDECKSQSALASFRFPLTAAVHLVADHCHPLYPGGGGERDFHNQQFHIKPVGGPEQSADEEWKLLESVSAVGHCLTLRNSFPPSPAAPKNVSWSERFHQMMRLLKSAGMNG